MFFYEIIIGDRHYHGDKPLTYSYTDRLSRGQIVSVSLQNRQVMGIVTKTIVKPAFKTKPIISVVQNATIPRKHLDFLSWLQGYYPSPLGIVAHLFMPPVTTPPKIIADKDNIHRSDLPNDPPLTHEQEAAIKMIPERGSCLLHGVTGSGKTRIYKELSLRTLRQNKSAIILTPEIGLTTPLVDYFANLPFPTFVFHSRMTAANRKDTWHSIINSEGPRIVIGPRSALFAPLDNIGLIVLDESHDQAYKNDTLPNYRTDRAAAKLAQFYDALFIMGSATPSIEDAYTFETKGLPIIALTKPAIKNAVSSQLEIIDMKNRSNYGTSSIFSRQLISSVGESLEQGNQSLIFINRRGTASAVLCENCGWRALCKHCDSPIAYHGDDHIMRCHQCGKVDRLPTICPECKSAKILFRSIGTKAVVEELERLFPAATIKRFDTDTPKSEQIENHFNEIKEGRVDIIVGTQMIAKGLDLPNLSVVGIVNADSSLLIPDYTANERAYQLIHQVAGRVGRRNLSSKVILQTYSPDNPILSAAVNKDWSSFYTNELSERKMYNFPPFCHTLKLSCLRASSLSAEKTANLLVQKLKSNVSGIIIEGPSPSFYPKENNKYKWHLVIKSNSRPKLIEIIKSLPSGWNYDIDPVQLL